MKSENNPQHKHSNWRRILMWLHRDLGFLFAGIICIYAISGIVLNHRSTFNPYNSVEISEATLPPSVPTEREAIGERDIQAIVDAAGEGGNYSKHYYSRGQLKILLKGGSSITADLHSRHMTVEKISQRVMIGNMVRLHYNPGRWWTAFSDIFAVALLVITITGLIIVRGRKGFVGRGGVLFLIGVAVPLVFLLM